MGGAAARDARDRLCPAWRFPREALPDRIGGRRDRLVGEDLDEAKDAARRDAESRSVPFFEDGAEPAQWSGYGTIASEIVDELGEDLGTVVVPTGNGALVAGIGLVLRKRAPSARVVAAIAKSAPVMALSYAAGHAVPCDEMQTFADGLAVRIAIPSAVALMTRVVDEVRLVSEREMARAMALYARAGIRAERGPRAPGWLRRSSCRFFRSPSWSS